MSSPYSVATDVLNNTLTTLITEAAWSNPADITIRIVEGDAEIDSRLAALGYALPFSTNPDQLKQLSVLYARYAIFRDLYAGGSPSAGTDAIKNFKDEYEAKFMKLEGGWASLTISGVVVAPSTSKFGVTVSKNTAPVDVQPGNIISSYISEVDENDGLSPSDSNDDDDDGI